MRPRTITMGVALLLGAILLLTGCDLIGETVNNIIRFTVGPDITVVDIKTGEPIEGASVTISYVGGLPADEDEPSDATVDTNSSGVAIFDDFPYARYSISVAKTDFTFIGETFDLSGADQNVTIYGFDQTANFDDTSITITAVWDADVDDVDLHVTYPAAFAEYTTLDDPYDDDVTGPTAGFLNDTDTNRERIFYNDKDATNTLSDVGIDTTGKAEFADEPTVELDVDDTDGRGPETVTIRAIPFDWYSEYQTDGFPAGFNGTDANRLPQQDDSGDDYTYQWYGEMNVYLHGYSDALMTEDSDVGADAEVFVFQGGNILGRFTLPGNQLINAVGLVRINMLSQYQPDAADDFEYFQIVPEIRVYNDTAVGATPTDGYTFRSVEGPEVINAVGRAR